METEYAIANQGSAFDCNSDSSPGPDERRCPLPSKEQGHSCAELFIPLFLDGVLEGTQGMSAMTMVRAHLVSLLEKLCRRYPRVISIHQQLSGLS
jgi:hypothetical protein